MLFFHSVGNVIIPTGPNSIIFQRGRYTNQFFLGISHLWGNPAHYPGHPECQSAEMINSVSVKGRRMGRFTDGNQNTHRYVYIYIYIYVCIYIYISIYIYIYIYTYVDNNHICGSHHQYWKSIPYLSCRNCQRVTICFRLTPTLHGQLDSRLQRFKSLKGGCCNEENPTISQPQI